jgi:hypothetical protein
MKTMAEQRRSLIQQKEQVKTSRVNQQLSPKAFVVKDSRKETRLACFSRRHGSTVVIASSFVSLKPSTRLMTYWLPSCELVTRYVHVPNPNIPEDFVAGSSNNKREWYT